jgi:hypothetical protein
VALLADGTACTAANQCQNGWCYGTPSVCQPNSCGDGTKDDVETDIDCGGAVCDAAGKTCGSGKVCKTDADCTSPLTCNQGSKKCQ